MSVLEHVWPVTRNHAVPHDMRSITWIDRPIDEKSSGYAQIQGLVSRDMVRVVSPTTSTTLSNVALAGDSPLQFKYQNKVGTQWPVIRFLAGSLLQDAHLYWGLADSFDSSYPQRLCPPLIVGADVVYLILYLQACASEEQTREYRYRKAMHIATLTPPATNLSTLDEHVGVLVVCWQFNYHSNQQGRFVLPKPDRWDNVRDCITCLKFFLVVIVCGAMAKLWLMYEGYDRVVSVVRIMFTLEVGAPSYSNTWLEDGWHRATDQDAKTGKSNNGLACAMFVAQFGEFLRLTYRTMHFTKRCVVRINPRHFLHWLAARCSPASA